MPLPPVLARLRLPVIGAPLFTISNPDLVIAQCTAGIVGAFPALNARPESALEAWITQIETALAAWNAAHPDRPAAPFAVNQIVHRSNVRLEHDLDICIRHRASFWQRSDQPPIAPPANPRLTFQATEGTRRNDRRCAARKRLARI